MGLCGGLWASKRGSRHWWMTRALWQVRYLTASLFHPIIDSRVWDLPLGDSNLGWNGKWSNVWIGRPESEEVILHHKHCYGRTNTTITWQNSLFIYLSGYDSGRPECHSWYNDIIIIYNNLIIVTMVQSGITTNNRKQLNSGSSNKKHWVWIRHLSFH